MRCLASIVRWTIANVIPGFLISVFLILLVSIAAELYLRASKPFVKTEWNSRFDPELGFVFVPGAIIRHTNYVDFWSEQKANSWGFLDREPPMAIDSHRCRIAFIGDSFVEAAQVPVEQKFHRLIEAEWNLSNTTNQIETIALGYSGTGQANQLPWAKLIRPLHPRLIVLVFVNNDFANNNAWLEAARNGWHPHHPPRPFTKNGMIQAPDPNWLSHLLPGQTGSAQAAWTKNIGGIRGWLHRRLYQKSYLYTTLWHVWNYRTNDISAFYSNVPDALRELKKLPAGKEVFGDWSPPNDLTLDQMFMAEKMPPVFWNALEDTRYAIRLWKAAAENLRARLVILATHTLKSTDLPTGRAAAVRRVRSDLLYTRLISIAQAEGIPVVDQAEYIIRSGATLEQASFSYDGHWSVFGHQTAAAAVLEYLRHNPDICARTYQ